ncbi:MAG: hypothetical protein LBG28_04160 [Tannerella sp.]|jgi:hypothetical protein|nr:hypothetical protein [Tannerella sp.]
MDTFYDTSKLTLPPRVELLNDCKVVCCNWWIDKLDCSQSYTRQGTDMPYEEIIPILTDKAYFVVIDRHYYMRNEKKHFEIEFCTMTSTEYFLFIFVEDELMFPIIQKYGLLPAKY